MGDNEREEGGGRSGIPAAWAGASVVPWAGGWEIETVVTLAVEKKREGSRVRRSSLHKAFKTAMWQENLRRLHIPDATVGRLDD
jgi:hypothetical protein